MNTLRILIIDRIDSHLNQGGDTVQINAIASFLSNCGYKVSINNELYPDCSGYHVAFLFNLTRPFETYVQSLAVRRANVPYILFPVYWNLDKVIPKSAYVTRNMVHVIKSNLPIYLVNKLRGYKFWMGNKEQLGKYSMKCSDLLNVRNMLSEVLEKASLICTNSEAETQHLITEFPLVNIQEKYRVIRNGFHFPDYKNYIPDNSLVRMTEGTFVCCVGGIGPRKNQINLAKAAKIAKVNLIIVGTASHENMKYYQSLLKEENEYVHFTGHLDKLGVAWIMSKAVGHIQPSYIETPGLASLEAASLGCRIGVSNVPPVREYFKDYAYYCNPASIDSIATTLSQMVQANDDQIKMQRYINENYRWETVLKPLENQIRKIIFNNGRW